MPQLTTVPLPGPIALPGSTLTAVLVSVVVIGALYFGREVLVPIALALLLSFALAPLVRLLQVLRFPRVIAVALVVLVAFAGISGLGALMVSQVNQLAEALPAYQATLRDKIQSLRGAAGGTHTLERASEVLQDLGREIDRPRGGLSTTAPTDRSQENRPILVEVKQPDPGALQTVAALIAPLVRPLTTTGIVIIFVFFILLQKEDLRNRLVRLAGSQDLQRTTAALDDAGQRLSRLFLMQLALNAGFGLLIGLGLWMIGVPSAPLWGMLAMIMRFVPYIGALISAIFPLVLAAAVGPGWSMVLMTAALFLITEPLVGHGLEPLVYGKSTGLSPVAVIASAAFWTSLWGPIGLILATPLTMCVVVLGRHVDRLKFLEVMFGDQPPLTPAELIYQRMLARDPVEAAEQARSFLKDKPLVAYYDEIVLEGLRLAQDDAARGLIDEERLRHVRDTLVEVVDDLGAHKDPAGTDEGRHADVSSDSPLAKLESAAGSPEIVPLPEAWRSGVPVLCIPGEGLLDEAAALVIAQLVERRGIGSKVEEVGALSMGRIFAWDAKGIELICLCYVERVTPAQVRYAIRRVRRRAPDVHVLVALLGREESIDAREISENADVVQETFSATIDKIVTHARSPTAREMNAHYSR